MASNESDWCIASVGWVYSNITSCASVVPGLVF